MCAITQYVKCLNLRRLFSSFAIHLIKEQQRTTMNTTKNNAWAEFDDQDLEYDDAPVSDWLTIAEPGWVEVLNPLDTSPAQTNTTLI